MANSLEFVLIEKGHSLFDFVSKYCLGEKSGLSHNSAFHRLCSLMRKMDVKTAIVEAYPRTQGEIKAECIALDTYFNQSVEVIAHRITFISEEISNIEDCSKLKNESFLSSAIIINFKDPAEGWKSYLFSSVVTIPKIKNSPKCGDIPLLNNYLHIYRAFNREIIISDNNRIEFSIIGTFFCQQNSITSVCAHASLCMVLNNMDLPSGIVTPEHINVIIGVDHKTKRFGKGQNFAFTNEEIKQVLSQYGLTYELLNFFENPNMEYNDYIYKYIESRCPVLLIFTTDLTTSHVVPILGHTLNSDMWRPEAETAYSPSSRLDYIKSSSAWVDHFIIHDDNFGMYLCLLIDSLKRVTLPKHDPTFRAHYAVVVKPSDVTTSPREAEWAGAILLEDILRSYKAAKLPLDIWADRLLERISKSKPIVIRTFLVTRDTYLKSLNKRDFEDNVFFDADKQELVKNLPDRFWLSEITLPELYTANKSKIIDFFYSCNNPNLSNKNEIYDRWIQIRFPFVLLRRNEGSSPSISGLSVKSHFPLLKHEREHDELEW